jgi:DNA primase small subunit
VFSFSRTSYTNVLKDYFEKILLTNQNLLATEERYEKILSMIPDECTFYYLCSPGMVLVI